MEKILKVSGMMCGHCEAHVRKALEALDGVVSALPSHEKGEVAVTLDRDVPLETLAQAVTGAGYTMEGVRS